MYQSENLQQAAALAIELGDQWRIQNAPQYLTANKVEEVFPSISQEDLDNYMSESQGITGHECHFQWTQNPTGTIDWCGYFVEAIYNEVGWPLATNLKGPDGIYALASATNFFNLVSGPDCPERFQFWLYEDYDDPQPGDIILMKAHIALVTGFDEN